MSKGIFVTGTDTGVGKTYLSCLLLKWMRARGVNAGAMKPVETGCGEEGGDLVPADALKLADAAGAADDMSLVAPFRFSAPVAPSVAARAEGRVIDTDEILRCYRELSSLHSFVLAEGAGGLLVPIKPDYSMLDLAVDLKLPVLIVAASKLGVINHSLLTLEAARGRDLKIVALALNNLDPETDDARRTNAATLRELVPEPVLELGFGASEHDMAAIGELLG